MPPRRGLFAGSCTQKSSDGNTFDLSSFCVFISVILALAKSASGLGRDGGELLRRKQRMVIKCSNAQSVLVMMLMR